MPTILQFPGPRVPSSLLIGPFQYQRRVIWRAWGKLRSNREWERREAWDNLDFYARHSFDPVVRDTASGLLAAARRKAGEATTNHTRL